MSEGTVSDVGQAVTGLVIRADPRAQVEAAGKDLQAFEDLMLTMIEQWGLPTEDIIINVREREKLLRNTPDALEGLDDTQRARASYVAKMILAASVGLFDAALNYLWNETINELRARVASFDVAYFFEIAEPDSTRRNDLRTADDLAKIDDAKLMAAANRIKLISDIGYKQLDHIRYMRNNASAAHPNQVALTGLKLAEWLETCIREVITLPKDPRRRRDQPASEQRQETAPHEDRADQCRGVLRQPPARPSRQPRRWSVRHLQPARRDPGHSGQCPQPLAGTLALRRRRPAQRMRAQAREVPRQRRR
ncbi:hypothetical protein [Amycolatopsis sp. cmx-11-51]|uniref:hypothetical protein n=1 Tax=unclassified Amycolatopsis TaxID=2618356 RepID=UPI0039E26679